MCASSIATTDTTPLVYGHRGAAGHRPEHTLESYRLAARLGADFIEPDLVATRDHALVVRHEPAIGGTTDVAGHPEFAGRRTTKVIDGVTFADEWFTEDFTLAELRTLRARERLPAVRSTRYDGRCGIVTFAEVVALRADLERELGRPVGLVPELKHSSYFRALGLPLEEPFLAALEAVDGRGALVVQSFEVGNLRHLTGLTRMQLLGAPGQTPADGTCTYGEMATAGGLREIARHAEIVGPAKRYLVPRDDQDRSLPPTSFVADAHAAGLQVVPYTFRDENRFLPAELRRGADPNAPGDAAAEYRQFYALGVDGVFSDHPDTAVAARDGR
jgi:glycerophosphoryl diester phosphodiesterase